MLHWQTSIFAGLSVMGLAGRHKATSIHDCQCQKLRSLNTFGGLVAGIDIFAALSWV
jgi:hypothetical protein